MPLYPNFQSLPPCPDPERYRLVETKEGCYWRLRRGQNKPATLNSVFQANADLVKICSPAAKRILNALAPFTYGMDMGRVQGRFTKLLKKGVKGNYFSYAAFKKEELQPKHPLDRLLQTQVSVTQPLHSLVVQLPIKPGFVQRHSNLISDFYVEAVLVSGDPLSGNPLKVDSVASPLFSYSAIPSTTCTLQLPVSAKPWLLLLKFNSHEGNEMAAHEKHYAMQVLEVGS
jgi:hypothetical protein